MTKLKNETIQIGQDGKPVTTFKTFNIKVKNSEDFYFTFLNFMKPALKIKSVRDLHVLTKLCLSMEFNTNKVALPSNRRKEICAELKIKNTHLSNSIQRLKILGLMWGEGGIYELSPFAVWKGHTDARDMFLKNEGLELKLKFKTTFESDEEYTEIKNPMLTGSEQFND